MEGFWRTSFRMSLLSTPIEGHQGRSAEGIGISLEQAYDCGVSRRAFAVECGHAVMVNTQHTNKEISTMDISKSI